ncbi:MAG: hypothetical protein ACKVOI_18880 [Dongiaceae bacterium]
MLIAALTLLSSTSALSCDLADILHTRAAITESNARYTEQRRVHYVTKPIMAGGHLRYQAPDRLEMIVELPKAESFIYQDGVLTVASGDSGSSKDIAVESQVLLSTLFAALVNTLSGNEAKLRSTFDLSFKELNEMFTDSGCVWRLSLVPREERARAKVSSIDVEGTQGRIEKIVLMLANGDSSMMLIREKE